MYEGGSYEALTCFDVNRGKSHGIFFEASSGMFISSRVFLTNNVFHVSVEYCIVFSERQLLC